jgi:SPP1 gp7 family putative phage head morphogenesis protein
LYSLANEIVQTLTNEIKTINNHSYRLIRTQVKDGINAGESINDISKRIQGVYKTNKARSRTIARTESMKVMTRSSDKEYRDAGVAKKRWLAESDARSSHRAAHNEGAIDYNAAFSNGLRYPGDSGPAAEVVNCRCVLVPEVE